MSTTTSAEVAYIDTTRAGTKGVYPYTHPLYGVYCHELDSATRYIEITAYYGNDIYVP